MSSQEQKKKEKGKEIVTFEEDPITSLHHVDHFDHTEEVSMYFTEQGIAALLEANKETQREKLESTKSKKDNVEEVNIQEKKSSSSKITPCIFYTSDDKARLRWSSDLHDCFVNAVAKLGGPDKATPKSVKEIMEVEGIALHHVKSHLQKFRLGKCNIRDGTDQCNKRFKTARGITKTYASSNSPRPQVNIRPKVMGAVKPKKAKEVQGSLYMLIEHDLHLQRCREAERMQMAIAIENQRKMLEAQYSKASLAQSISSQHNNYTSTAKTTITPKATTSVEDFCNDNMACLSLSDFTHQTSNTCLMYEPQHVNNSSIHSTQEKLQGNDNHNYNMAQGFINPYMAIEPQSMPCSSTIDGLTHDSYHNATVLPTTIPSTVDSFYQNNSNNTILFSTTPPSVQTYIPHHTYNSYPPYNTLEVVKAQLSAIQNSSTSQIQETSRDTNLSSSATTDEVDPVDKYIDWGKVEEMYIDQLDPVEVLEALGFGVSP